MNTKLIHTIIFALLMSLTAHEAHSAVSHDVEACEVCIHIQSNDDALNTPANSYSEFETALPTKCSGNINALFNKRSYTADLIRGPPAHS